MEYRGYQLNYKIEQGIGHYEVISPTGEVWSEDTKEDAQDEIDKILKG